MFIAHRPETLACAEIDHFVDSNKMVENRMRFSFQLSVWVLFTENICSGMAQAVR
jgi:hypothetical protein